MNLYKIQPIITHFQQGHPFRFFSKIAKNHTISKGLPLSIFFKKSHKSHIFNRVIPIDFLQKYPKMTQFFFKKTKNHTFSIELSLSIFFKKSQKSHNFNRVSPIDFLQKKPKITHFQYSYPYRFSPKISKNHTFSIELHLSIWFKNSQKSHTFNRVTPIDFLPKKTKITHFQQG